MHIDVIWLFNVIYAIGNEGELAIRIHKVGKMMVKPEE